MSGIFAFIVIVLVGFVFPRLASKAARGASTPAQKAPPVAPVGPRSAMVRRELERYVLTQCRKNIRNGQALTELAIPEELSRRLHASGLSMEEAQEIAVAASERAKSESRPIPKPSESHAGESYASPIPPPRQSPLVGQCAPSLRHVEEHLGSQPVAPSLPKRGLPASAAHAEAHIATTPAEQTPSSGRVTKRKAMADWIPRGDAGLRKALVMSEIVGPPKSLR